MKYRAWDPIKKQMWYNQFCVTSSGNIQKSEIAREWHSWRDEPWILLCLTGVYDKTGKEVCEGDVVYINEIFNQGKAIVEWDRENTGFYPFTSCSFGGAECSYRNMEAVEIIGNIYENPELMENNENVNT